MDKLVEHGALIQFKVSNWATSIIAVPNPNDEFRDCMVCNVTINRMLRIEQYPPLRTKGIFVLLSLARVFCALDLKGAFQQSKISRQSHELLIINTIFDLYQHIYLTHGISPAPSIFQRFMDRILKGVIGAYCYLDNIFTGG